MNPKKPDFFKWNFFDIIICTFFLSGSCVHYERSRKNHHHNSSFAHQTIIQSHSLNQIIRDLSFFPINSERFRLSELKDIKAIVFFMREKDCPISEKYGPRIARLERKFSKKGIRFIYNYVGQVKREKSAVNDLKRFGFKEPYVIDSRQTIVTALNAKTTGDVFILTPKRKIIYRGPLDDQHHLLRSALKAKNNYVSDMLDAIVSDKNIKPKELPAPGCIIDFPVVKEKVFWRDVAPVIQKKCTVCHNPSGSASIDYVSYEDVIGRQAMFRYVIQNDLMPPWFVDPNTGPWRDNLSLTPREKALLLKWIDDGSSKQSKKTQLLWVEKKEPNVTPDYIIPLPEKVVIPKEGFNNYKTFTIQTNFKEDKWIKSVKFRLKPKVIHHVFLYVMDTSFNSLKDIPSNRRMYSSAIFGAGSSTQQSNWITFQQSNSVIKRINKTVGYKLPRGASLILKIHYESLGRKIVDDFTQVYMKFSKKKPKYRTVTYTIEAPDTKINIPPLVSNYKIKTVYKTKEKWTLIEVRPHMHLRGKASSILITNPKGIKKRIFGVDPFMISFEKAYMLKTPLIIPKGSILECVNWFDNSKNNPLNPNPNKNVMYGLFRKDEMSLCHFRLLVPIDSKMRNQLIKNS